MRSSEPKPAVQRAIRAYFGFQFFFSLLLWLPVFYEFQKRIGLSDTQIFSIQSIYYIVFCLLEIPTGMLGDRWGYRNCMKLGSITLVVSNLLPVFAPGYTGFLWHFLLIALSRSLISGSSSAYLYDYLDRHSAATEYKEIEGKARAYGLIGKVACWAFVGSLMELKLTLPYWLTALSAVVSVVYAWMLPAEVGTVAATESKSARGAFGDINGALSDVATLARILRSSPYLLFLMLQGVAIFTLGRIAQVNLFQPILGAKTFSVSSYGLVMSLMTVFEAIGSAYPGALRRWMDDLSAVFVLTLIMALSLGAIPYFGQVGTLICLNIFSLVTGISFPIQRQLINDSIADRRYRATVLSAESIIDRAVCAWVASLLGASLSDGHLDQFLVASAVITLASVAALLLVMRIGLVSRQQAPSVKEAS